METYWCTKKNSIFDRMKNPENHNPARTHVISLNVIGGIMGYVSRSTKQEDNSHLFKIALFLIYHIIIAKNT